MQTVHMKSAFGTALTACAGIATLLVAIGSGVEPTTFSPEVANRRCTWQIDPHRFRGGLHDATAISRRNVWAVGFTEAYEPLALHWLGAGWRRVNVPRGAQGPDYLWAVAFAASNDGWAVGYGVPSDAIEHWDGRRWTVVRSADLGDRGAWFLDVAVLGKNDVWAVGMSTTPTHGGPGRALIEHWNGIRWEAPPIPDVGQSRLVALAAISQNNVWAVGNQVDNILIEHWDGKSWEVMPNPAAPLGAFVDIAAVSARDIWAVGSRGPPWPARQRPLIQHWDGTKWRLVPSPFGPRSSLDSIAALSSGDIWISARSAGAIVVRHRLEARWRSVQIPHIKRQYNLLIAAAAGSNDIWAIGETATANYLDTRAIIEHYHCRP
jgi:hypothetical protein